MTTDLPPALAENVGFLLSISSAKSVALANTALAPLGLKARGYTALSLVAAGDGMSQRDIAEALRMDPSQVVALVDALESKGLVERRPNPSDRRLRSVVATAEGRKVRKKAAQVIQDSVTTLLADFSAEERELLHGLLSRLATAKVVEPALT